jgi:hypothetical protein
MPGKHTVLDWHFRNAGCFMGFIGLVPVLSIQRMRGFQAKGITKVLIPGSG